MSVRTFIPQMEAWFDEREGEALLECMKNNGSGRAGTAQFEKAIASFTGAKYAAASVNGTVTLFLGLVALGLKEGDEVLVPATTMIASANACVLAKTKPVLVDVEATTLCMDMKKAADAITPKTKAIMYVPLNGRCGNMDEVVQFAKDHNLFLLEDAAQALGSYYKGNHWFKQHLGTFGDMGSFSFSLHKIITTSQGGALITNNKELDTKARLIKDFGQDAGQDIHNSMGWNFKMSQMLALIGVIQFEKLPSRIIRKKEIYKRYVDNLSSIPEIEFIPTDLAYTTPWFIDIFVPDREKLAAHLKNKGIGTRFFYPAINTQKIYADDYRGKSFPVSEKYGERGLWLPSACQLTNEEIDHVTNSIHTYYRA